MHSLRRAAARAALTASRGIQTNVKTTSFAAQLTRAQPASRLALNSALRSFSQTFRALESADSQRTPAAAEGESYPETTPAGQEKSAELKPGETPYAIFIRNLTFEANEEHLKEAFSKYGTVASTFISKDTRGLSKGWGFVYFTNAEDMNQAVVEANGSFWHGRRIAVAPRRTDPKPARTRQEGPPRDPTASLYIGNIPYETTDVELNRLFRDLENVVDIRVAVDRTTGWPRGFAHADFVDVESATKGRAKLQGTLIGERELRVDFAENRNRPSGDKRSDN